MTNEEFTQQFDALKSTINAMAADIAALKVEQNNPGTEPDPAPEDKTDWFEKFFTDN